MSDNDIGKKMYERRKQLGLSLEAVGDAVGVGKSTVRKWENGMIKNMGRDKIVLLAKVLQISPVELVPGSDPTDVLSSEERHLVTVYRGATREIRSAALRMLEDSASQKSAKKQSISEKII